MSHKIKKEDKRLEEAVYSGYYIGPEGLILSERGEITTWFVSEENHICCSDYFPDSRRYKLRNWKINSGRRDTGFYVKIDNCKKKIYGPEKRLPWM